MSQSTRFPTVFLHTGCFSEIVRKMGVVDCGVYNPTLHELGHFTWLEEAWRRGQEMKKQMERFNATETD